MFTVNEELLTLMDSIVEEHECTGKACNRVLENNCSGIEPHDRHPAVLNEFFYGSPKLQKDTERSMECEVPEKTHNQMKWAVKVWTE